MFPLVWDRCTEEKQQQQLLDDVVFFLSQDFHKTQRSYYFSFMLGGAPARRSSSAIQVFLEGLTRCRNLTTLPPSLLQSIAETYDPFHASYLVEEAWKQKEASLAEWRDVLVGSFSAAEK